MHFPSPFLYTCLFFTLTAVSIKDFREGIIPDGLVLLVALLGFVLYGINHVLSIVILGCIGYGLYKIYPFFKKREGLGLGDVKLMAAAGFWLEPFQLPLFLFISGGVGILIALLWQFLKKGVRFPLGPALALGLGICIVSNDVFSKGENEMNIVFSGPSLQPFSGSQPKSIVVLIHGYGADGDDLLALGKSWASLLPDTLFIAPHGPSVCEMNSSGNQWFGLKDWDSARILKEIQTLTPSFNRYLDALLKTYNLSPDRLALVGFSQGAMLALHIAIHRPQCAGVVAYSGAFLNDPKELKVGRPPILLIHGTEDQVLQASFSQMAAEHLKALHIPVTLSLLPELEHGIDGRGLGMGGAFLKEHLYETPPSHLWEQKKQSNNS
ncbi:MAG: prepilin peptidase [Proteobacteria bacterium]|nr:prepilin peptidase [Pseudomonadota bacterium]